MSKRRVTRKARHARRRPHVTLGVAAEGLDVADILALDMDPDARAMTAFLALQGGSLTGRPGESTDDMMMRRMAEWMEATVDQAFTNVKAHVAGRASDDAAWMWTVTLLNSPLMEGFDEEQHAQFVAEKMGITPEQVDAYITELAEAGCFDDLTDDSLGGL